MLLTSRATTDQRAPERGKLRREVEAFIDANLARPETVAACKLLGEYYIYEGAPAKGVAWLEKSLPHDLVNPMMDVNRLMTLARVLHRDLGELKRAREVYQLFLDRYPVSYMAVVAKRFIAEIDAAAKERQP
jgi:tetratricopeptide (TPR) repeat protein